MPMESKTGTLPIRVLSLAKEPSLTMAKKWELWFFTQAFGWGFRIQFHLFMYLLVSDLVSVVLHHVSYLLALEFCRSCHFVDGSCSKILCVIGAYWIWYVVSIYLVSPFLCTYGLFSYFSLGSFWLELMFLYYFGSSKYLFCQKWFWTLWKSCYKLGSIFTW